MEYISLSDAKKIFPDMDPEVLKNHIAIATAAIDALIGGSLALTDRVARIDGNDSKFLYLADKPESVQKITDGRHTYAVDFIDGHMIALDHAAPKGLKNMVVHYRAGFAQVPQDFRMYFAYFLKSMVQMSEANDTIPYGVQSQRIGDTSVTYLTPDQLANTQAGAVLNSPALQKILAKYTRTSFFSTL